MVMIFDGVDRLAAAPFGVEEDDDVETITSHRTCVNPDPPIRKGEVVRGCTGKTGGDAVHDGSGTGGTAKGEEVCGVPWSQSRGLLPQKERRGNGRGVRWNSAARCAFDGVPFASIGQCLATAC